MLKYLICLAAVGIAASDRTITLRNNCGFTIWPAGTGAPLPPQTGWELGPGASTSVTVPNSFVASRFWARTGCSTVDGRFKCQSGDCGAEVNGFGIECRGITGQPATLAEFTLLDNGQPDYYDLSNVDGYNIGIKIDSQGTNVNNPDLGQFNCGDPTCVLNTGSCPEELKYSDVNGNVMCYSICAAVNNADQRGRFQVLQDIWNSGQASLVCCACDCGPDCGCTNPASKYCCSPNNNDPNEQGGKCYVENWPKPVTGSYERYDLVFKQQCPQAYSWQFDDLSSTYQCMSANYEITFCP